MALSMRRRPRRYSASRRGVRGRLGGIDGMGPQAVSPNVLPVPGGGEVGSIAQPLPPGGGAAPAPAAGATTIEQVIANGGRAAGGSADQSQVFYIDAAGTTMYTFTRNANGGYDFVSQNAVSGSGVMPAAPGGAAAAGNAAPSGAASAPAGPLPGQPASNPDAGTNRNYGGSPTVADKAIVNGIEVWAGGPYAGRPVASSPGNAGDLTPYLANPRLGDPTGRVSMERPGALGDASAPLPTPTLNPVDQAAAGQVAPGQKPKYVGEGGVLIYDHGGLVDEPVIARGARSGKTYLFDTVQITPMDTGLSAKHHTPASAAAPSDAPLKRPGKK